MVGNNPGEFFLCQLWRINICSLCNFDYHSFFSESQPIWVKYSLCTKDVLLVAFLNGHSVLMQSSLLTLSQTNIKSTFSPHLPWSFIYIEISYGRTSPRKLFNVILSFLLWILDQQNSLALMISLLCALLYRNCTETIISWWNVLIIALFWSDWRDLPTKALNNSVGIRLGKAF